MGQSGQSQLFSSYQKSGNFSKSISGSSSWQYNAENFLSAHTYSSHTRDQYRTENFLSYSSPPNSAIPLDRFATSILGTLFDLHYLKQPPSELSASYSSHHG